MGVWVILLSIVGSVIGSLIAWIVVIHWDLEGLWEQRRLQHGKELDQRQREAAEKHGKRSGKTT